MTSQNPGLRWLIAAPLSATPSSRTLDLVDVLDQLGFTATVDLGPALGAAAPLPTAHAFPRQRAFGLGLQGSEPRIVVVGGALDAGRARVVGQPLPGADPETHPRIGELRLVARHCRGREAGRAGGAHQARALDVGQQAHIDVAVRLVGADQLAHALAQVVELVDLVEAQQLHADLQPPDVLIEAEQQKAPCRRVMVGAQALEDRDRVGHRERQWMDTGFGEGQQFAIHHDEFRGPHD